MAIVSRVKDNAKKLVVLAQRTRLKFTRMAKQKKNRRPSFPFAELDNSGIIVSVSEKKKKRSARCFFT